MSRTRSIHRLRIGLGAALAIGVLMAPSPARAQEVECTSAEQPSRANAKSALSADDESRTLSVPIDAHPWLFASCLDPETAFDCKLYSDNADDIVQVQAEGLARACNDTFQRAHLIRLVPERQLLPARRYSLLCASTPLYAEITVGPVDKLLLATKASTTLSQPPIDLTGTGATLRRRDDTCCAQDPLYIEISASE
ncbi:MAG TPA: hypothetical protein ENJ18_11225, partial [Nannocystis exedens]|nr:hypothetical protein [Nannocystis exedens]